MPALSPEEQKALLKQALQEWLDEKYAEFGKWTLRGIAAAFLVVLIMFLNSHGVKIEEFIK
ncbi:MAG: hypothetical protein WC426_02630 [Sulfuriferula sp.]